jgi:hypothetical protein
MRPELLLTFRTGREDSLLVTKERRFKLRLGRRFSMFASMK